MGIPFTTDDIGRYRRQSENWVYYFARECKGIFAISPPVEQVAQLRNLSGARQYRRKSVSAEEAFVSSEMNGMLMNYVGKKGSRRWAYEVYI